MQEIISKNALKAIGPYSQAVSNGTMLFVSGQLPIDPTNLKMPETIEVYPKHTDDFNGSWIKPGTCYKNYCLFTRFTRL